MNKIKNTILGVLIISILFLTPQITYAIDYNNRKFEIEDYVKELAQIKEQQSIIENQIEEDVDDSPKVVKVSLVQNEIQDTKLLEDKLQELVIEEVKIIKYIEQETKEKLAKTNSSYEKGMWPLENYTELSSPYGTRIHPISKVVKFHHGVDIPAPQGTEILSSDNGIVMFSGPQNGYGNVIKIKHFDGRVSVYAHNSENLVSENDIILKGQVIGLVGSTGDSTGNHLHFEIQVDDDTINPMTGVEKNISKIKTEGY